MAGGRLRDAREQARRAGRRQGTEGPRRLARNGHAREEAEKLIVRALQGETFTIETSRMSRHSDEIAVSVTIAPIRSADGKITGLSAITRDIRDRKRAEAALAQSMAQLNSLLTNAPIGFAFFNREHKFVRVNEYFSRLDGLPVEAHLDSKIEDVLPRNAAIFTPLLDQVFDTRRAITDVELSAESPGEPGSERQWLIGIYPVMMTKITVLEASG